MRRHAASVLLILLDCSVNKWLIVAVMDGDSIEKEGKTDRRIRVHEYYPRINFFTPNGASSLAFVGINVFSCQLLLSMVAQQRVEFGFWMIFVRSMWYVKAIFIEKPFVNFNFVWLWGIQIYWMHKNRKYIPMCMFALNFIIRRRFQFIESTHILFWVLIQKSLANYVLRKKRKNYDRLLRQNERWNKKADSEGANPQIYNHALHPKSKIYRLLSKFARSTALQRVVLILSSNRTGKLSINQTYGRSSAAKK